MRDAEKQFERQDAEDRAVVDIVGGGKLAQYRPIGKKKNDRVFWVTAENATISWDKKPKKYASTPHLDLQGDRQLAQLDFSLSLPFVPPSLPTACTPPPPVLTAGDPPPAAP